MTSVTKGGAPSRLNFLSATLCVDIAEQLLRDDRPDLVENDRPRILIVNPYRPHAKLLNLLLKEQKLNVGDAEVMAGTAHQFQGIEADIVIMDLVVDEPHWRANLFTPQIDEEMKRVLNVALTRARRRLIVVGDFAYCQRRGKKAFLGGELIPFLLNRYPRVDALEIAPNGLAARAAKAQQAVFGGKIDPKAERLVITQEDFFPILIGDIEAAKKTVVIYSPFITRNRLSELDQQLKAALERGVKIYVITKTRGERNKSEVASYRILEDALTSWGVIVIHKLNMHEKLVFIDDTILWSGSLNPLSFRSTQEIIERRFSKQVVEEYANALRLYDLLQVYDEGEAMCPICSDEMIPAEGAGQPFYWRCIDKDCGYTRGIDQPLPEDGLLTCATCSGKLKFGYWGNKPHWRCANNNRHHMFIRRNHLKLPKMRDLIPNGELRKLCRFWDIELPAPKQFSKQQQLFNF